MKICIVSDFFIPHYLGGGERRYYEILKRLVARGHKIDLVCMRIKGVSDMEKIEGIQVHHIGPVISNPPERTLVDFLHFVFAAFFWMMKRDYDLIEGNAWAGLLPVSIVGKLKKLTSFAVIHDISSGNSDQWMGLPRISGLSEKLLLKLPFKRIINVSRGVKDRLVNEYKIKAKKIVVINNGVDLNLIDNVKTGKKGKNSIIFVGRLIPHKHVDDLLKAVRILRKDIKDINLKVVGGGQELDSLKKLSAKLGLEKNVKFFSTLEDYKDVIKEIKKSSVLVLPSTREGFGLVLAEAFACNTPCVAYYSDGVVDVIEDKVNGYLVKQRDVEELASKIKKLVLDDAKSRRFSRSGRLKTEKLFTWDRITDRIEKEYVQFGVSKK